MEGLLQSDIRFRQALCFLLLYFSVFFFFKEGLNLDSKDYKSLIKAIFFLFGIIVDTGIWGKFPLAKRCWANCRWWQSRTQRAISPSLAWSPANLTSHSQKRLPKLSFLPGCFQEVLVCEGPELSICFLHYHIGNGGNAQISDKIQNKQAHIKTNKLSIFLKDSRTSVGEVIFHSLLMRRTECLFKSVVSFDGNYNRMWPQLILGDRGPGLSLSFPWFVGMENGALVPWTWVLML